MIQIVFTALGLDADEDTTRRVLATYNGSGDAAADYGHQLLGVVQVFEKYHKMIRER